MHYQTHSFAQIPPIAIVQIADRPATSSLHTAWMVALSPPPTIAQTPPDPNRDRLIPAPQPTLPPLQDTAPVLPNAPAVPPAAADLPTPAFPVRKILIIGSTVFQPADFAPLTQPFEGKTATREELNGIATAITLRYLNQGYINSRASEPEARGDGTITIRVIEGSIERIDINGNQRLTTAYIRDRVKLGITTPVRQDKLEDQLRLLRSDPILSNVEATLGPGNGLGKSILTVQVKEAKAIYGGITSDNFSSPVVGSERIGTYLGLRNPLSLGDELTFSYNRTTTGGANVYDIGYRLPVNPMNGTIQLRIAPSNNRITDSKASAGLNIGGSSNLYDLSYRQPLIRSTTQEFALSLGLTLQDGDTFITEDTRFNTNNQARLIKFGQDYLSRDRQGTWAIRSQFNFGFSTFSTDPNINSSFFSWIGQAQRIQRVSNSNFLIAQFDLQLTPDQLVPSQQFVIGGGQSVRGYRQNARSGDNGWRFSLEDRLAIAWNNSGNPVLQLAPFIDLGAVWNVRDPVKQNFLSSGGVGLIWQPFERANLRLDYALPFRSVQERGSNLQDRAFYFSVNYQL